MRPVPRKATEVQKNLNAIAQAYYVAALALRTIGDAPSEYSRRTGRPTTDVKRQQIEALVKLGRLGSRSLIAARALMNLAEGDTGTSLAVERLVDAIAEHAMADDAADRRKLAGRLRDAAAVLHGRDPKRGQVEKVSTLARCVQQALAHHTTQLGEAQDIARHILPQLEARRVVSEEEVFELLKTWAPRAAKGKHTVAGLVRILAIKAGILPQRGSEKRVAGILRRTGIRNEARPFERADGTLVGRSLPMIMVEELSYAPLRRTAGATVRNPL